MSRKILLLPGDGVGPEIINQAQKVLESAVAIFGLELEIDTDEIGGASIDKYNTPVTDLVLSKATESDAVLLGAVGGYKWDGLPITNRPEAGLLKLRNAMQVFANLRPSIANSCLIHASSLKAEVISGLDVLIVRELNGGIYFGEPRGIKKNKQGVKVGYNTYIYDENEIKRIAKIAFKIAQQRNKKLCSVDKANVLEVSALWRDVVTQVSRDFPDVGLSHMYVDNAAMQLVKDPKQFDVILTGNMFGDILSDIAAMLTGSIGLLPSASINERLQGLYEPIHGSAPNIAGKDVANPIGAILSLAMLIRYSFEQENIAQAIEDAVNAVIQDGYRTEDLMPFKSADVTEVSTNKMGDLVAEYMQ